MDVCGGIIDCRMIEIHGLPLSTPSEIVLHTLSTTILRGILRSIRSIYCGTISTKPLRVIINFSKNNLKSNFSNDSWGFRILLKNKNHWVQWVWLYNMKSFAINSRKQGEAVKSDKL
jgi:hypothetical protein